MEGSLPPNLGFLNADRVRPQWTRQAQEALRQALEFFLPPTTLSTVEIVKSRFALVCVQIWLFMTGNRQPLSLAWSLADPIWEEYRFFGSIVPLGYLALLFASKAGVVGPDGLCISFSLFSTVFGIGMAKFTSTMQNWGEVMEAKHRIL